MFIWMILFSDMRAQSKRENFLCGGTLINKNYVVTGKMVCKKLLVNTNNYWMQFSLAIAAHCITSRLRPISVRLGETNLQTSPDFEVFLVQYLNFDFWFHIWRTLYIIFNSRKLNLMMAAVLRYFISNGLYAFWSLMARI